MFVTFWQNPDPSIQSSGNAGSLAESTQPSRQVRHEHEQANRDRAQGCKQYSARGDVFRDRDVWTVLGNGGIGERFECSVQGFGNPNHGRGDGKQGPVERAQAEKCAQRDDQRGRRCVNPRIGLAIQRVEPLERVSEAPFTTESPCQKRRRHVPSMNRGARPRAWRIDGELPEPQSPQASAAPTSERAWGGLTPELMTWATRCAMYGG